MQGEVGPDSRTVFIVGWLVCRGNILGGRRRTLAEEELLHLPHDYLLILFARRVETVLIEQHLAELRPLIPGFLGDVLVDLLAQVSIEGWLGQSGQLFLQFCAKDFVVRHGSG